jgi:trigger factor
MVKENLENYKKFLIEEEVVKKLIELHEFEIPQTLLRRELSFLVERRLRELSSLGIDTRYVNIQGLAQELLPQAITNIKLRYILDKYAQTKNLQAEKKDLEEEYTKLAQAYGVSSEQIKADVQSRNLEEVIKGDVLRRKALEDIMSKVQVIEVEEKKEEKKDENT